MIAPDSRSPRPDPDRFVELRSLYSAAFWEQFPLVWSFGCVAAGGGQTRCRRFFGGLLAGALSGSTFAAGSGDFGSGFEGSGDLLRASVAAAKGLLGFLMVSGIGFLALK